LVILCSEGAAFLDSLSSKHGHTLCLNTRKGVAVKSRNWLFLLLLLLLLLGVEIVGNKRMLLGKHDSFLSLAAFEGLPPIEDFDEVTLTPINNPIKAVPHKKTLKVAPKVQ